MQQMKPTVVVRRNVPGAQVMVAAPEPEPETPKSKLLKKRKNARERGTWTRADPYERADGTKVRSTTVYLPIELHDELRTYAFINDIKQSQVIEEAIIAFLKNKD